MKNNGYIKTQQQKGYIEEMIILDETKEMLKYSLSNSLDDIKTAIYARTGNNIDLNYARWRINTILSSSVKHLMNKYRVNYSMTTFIEKKTKCIVINMRVGDNWFITGYDEIKGVFHNWDFIETLAKAIDLITSNFLKDDDEE